MTPARFRIAAALATLAVAVGPFAAAHQTTADCSGTVRGGENVIVLPPISGDEVLYLDRVQVGLPYVLAFWLYEESNGHPGLQTRAGTDSAVYEGSRENCTIPSGHVSVTQPDTFLF